MTAETRIIACRFSAGLDDLTRKQQADAVAVLRVLARTKRYSVFEASDNMVIARTMTRLHHKGYMHYGLLLKAVGGAYPWTEVELTEGGRRLLADADAATTAPKEGKSLPPESADRLNKALPNDSSSLSGEKN